MYIFASFVIVPASLFHWYQFWSLLRTCIIHWSRK